MTLEEVTVRKHILVYKPSVAPEIVKTEVFNFGKNLTPMEQWEDGCGVMVNQALIRGLVPIRAVIFHAVFL